MTQSKKNSSSLVLNDLLGYPGLKIYQRPDTFNFSLDSTILAYFVSLNLSTKKVIDLGCGNGYIPIFLSLRTNAKLYGVEIQEDLFNLAIKSVEYNHLENRIQLYCGDIKTIYETVGVQQFDCVTCNPPYFVYNDSSNINCNDYLTIARHEVKITLEDCLQASVRLLKDQGKLAMVHRTARFTDVLFMFKKYHIEPIRVLFVYPKHSSSESKLFFIEGRKTTSVSNLKILPPIYVKNEDDTYTEEILKIFNYKKVE